jgi:hypothetical protein
MITRDEENASARTLFGFEHELNPFSELNSKLKLNSDVELISNGYVDCLMT